MTCTCACDVTQSCLNRRGGRWRRRWRWRMSCERKRQRCQAHSCPFPCPPTTSSGSSPWPERAGTTAGWAGRRPRAGWPTAATSWCGRAALRRASMCWVGCRATPPSTCCSWTQRERLVGRPAGAYLLHTTLRATHAAIWPSANNALSSHRTNRICFFPLFLLIHYTLCILLVSHSLIIYVFYS